MAKRERAAMIARKSMAIELLFDLLTDAGEGLGETAAEWLAEFPRATGDARPHVWCRERHNANTNAPG
jgi:hypothetical protein